jgi:hypothetical protein
MSNQQTKTPLEAEKNNDEKILLVEDADIVGIEVVEEAAKVDANFDETLVKKYPHSAKKINLHVSEFGINHDEDAEEDDKNGQSTFISPHGIEFRTASDYPEGSLLKIQIKIPDYWARKQKFVEYTRIDNPTEFRVLAKVLKTEDVGKRGKKKLVLAQTLIMDSVDEKVLKSFLQDE